MTVPTNDNRETIAGNDVTTAWSVPLKIWAKTDIKATKVDASGNETLLTVDVDYTVTSINSETPTFTFTYPVSGDELATGESIVILGELDYTQEVDLRNQGAYQPQNVEEGLDRAVMLAQQLLESVGRQFSMPVSTDVGSVSTALGSPVANGYWKWNADADAVEFVTTVEFPDTSITFSPGDAGKPAGVNSAEDDLEVLDALPAGFVVKDTLAADCVDGTKIEDESIDSEHYVDGSIDTEHYSDGSVTIAKTNFVDGYRADVASFNGSYKDVSAQDSSPLSVAFSSDGTKMYIAGNAGDAIFQYTLSTAWDLSTASYASKSADVSSETTAPCGVAFGDSGTKMYVLDITSDDVFQYTLSTAWDVSTASYASKTVSLSGQVSTPEEIVFNGDGSKMWALDSVSDADVYEYTLSTPWDVSTATYATVTKSFSAQVGANGGGGLAFNNDGSMCFVMCNVNDEIYCYRLTTPYNVSTANYMAKRELLWANTPSGMVFGNSGHRLYILDAGDDTVYQFSTGAVY